MSENDGKTAARGRGKETRKSYLCFDERSMADEREMRRNVRARDAHPGY